MTKPHTSLLSPQSPTHFLDTQGKATTVLLDETTKLEALPGTQNQGQSESQPKQSITNTSVPTTNH